VNPTLAEHVRIRGGRPLRGKLRAPADLAVASGALLFAALSDGRSELLDVPEAESLTNSLHAWRALGVECAHDGGVIAIRGVGLDGLQMPSAALDCGRSWSALAMFAGVLSGQHFGTRITVHPTLAQHSVEHLVGPLRARGAHIAGRTQGDSIVPPIAVAPLIEPELLSGLDATLPWADPAAKSAALISGLWAAGVTTISEPSISADHTERLMVGLGLPLRRVGSVVVFDPSAWDRRIPALGPLALPGSTTLAGYLAVAAQLLPGSDITLTNVGINPSRSGALEMLAQWGRAVSVVPKGDAALREPIADIRVCSAALRGGVIGGELLVRARDELPALALLGVVAQRGVRLCDLAWLGAEPDSTWAALDPLLGAFGIAVERSAGELYVPRQAQPRPAQVDARDDPRLSICACVLGLASAGETVVKHAANALSAVYPGFIEAARALGAELDLV
jgi:3-phosphoshikimate 1-carboxyvinyltransferase